MRLKLSVPSLMRDVGQRRLSGNFKNAQESLQRSCHSAYVCAVCPVHPICPKWLSQAAHLLLGHMGRRHSYGLRCPTSRWGRCWRLAHWCVGPHHLLCGAYLMVEEIRPDDYSDRLGLSCGCAIGCPDMVSHFESILGGPDPYEHRLDRIWPHCAKSLLQTRRRAYLVLLSRSTSQRNSHCRTRALLTNYGDVPTGRWTRMSCAVFVYCNTSPHGFHSLNTTCRPTTACSDLDHHKVHAPNCDSRFKDSVCALQVWRPIADAGRRAAPKGHL
jgi:hypothetical protein